MLTLFSRNSLCVYCIRKNKNRVPIVPIQQPILFLFPFSLSIQFTCTYVRSIGKNLPYFDDKHEISVERERAVNDEGTHKRS